MAQQLKMKFLQLFRCFNGVDSHQLANDMNSAELNSAELNPAELNPAELNPDIHQLECSADWAELSPDVLRLVSKKLGELSNFVRFRAVCKPWRAHVLPSNHPPQLPWLIDYEPKTSDLKFFPLYSDKTHTLHVPQAKGKMILGPSKGYLFIKNTDDSPESFLVNPLTKSCFTISDREIPKESFTNHTRSIYIGPSEKPKPNSDGFENGMSVVVCIGDRYTSPLFDVIIWRSDHESTTLCDVPCAYHTAYYKGRVFLHENFYTTIIDVNTEKKVVIQNNGVRFIYLIEASGDLLGIVSLHGFPKREYEVYKFIEDSDGEPKWEKMESGIGDRMLFFGHHSGFCIEARDFDGLKGNCIYIHLSENNIGRYDIETKKTEELPIPCPLYSTWLVPSLC